MSLFLVAEIGINHNGDLLVAKKLIEAAADAGFDAVKFQKRTIDAVYTQEFLDSRRDSPWGTTQREQKQGLEFGDEEYSLINDYCEKLNIGWSASAWDLQSVEFIRKFDVGFNKIASAMLGHLPFLREVALEGKKTFLSTGMATIEEIDQAVEVFQEANCPFELMHCNSTYPMPEEDANLRCIPMLKERYRCDVGYSGHESSLLKVSAAAVALGATSIERHITMDRAMYGSDQAASVSANALRGFVEAVRKVPLILGSGEKVITPAEAAVREKLRIDVGE